MALLLPPFHSISAIASNLFPKRHFVVYVSALAARPSHTEMKETTLGQFSFNCRNLEVVGARELARIAKRASREGKGVCLFVGGVKN